LQAIDRYAYSNRIRNVDPAYKATLAVAVLLLCLILDEPLVGLAATVGIWALAVWVAGLPARAFGQILLAEAFFLALVSAGVAISIGVGTPGREGLYAVHLGPMWLSTGPEGLALAARLVTRALGGTAAMNFLAMTTPLVDLVDLFRRLGLPPVLIDLMTLMYRFIFVLMDSLERMYVAQNSRLGYLSWKRALSSAGQLAARLFIDAYRRTERLQISLDARGYHGELRVLPAAYRRDDMLLLTGLCVVLSLVIIWGAL